MAVISRSSWHSDALTLPTMTTLGISALTTRPASLSWETGGRRGV